MHVIVNGESHDLAEATSVAALLTHLELRPGRVAVEVNEEVVPRDAYATQILVDGDRVEIVHFVGGGC